MTSLVWQLEHRDTGELRYYVTGGHARAAQRKLGRCKWRCFRAERREKPEPVPAEPAAESPNEVTRRLPRRLCDYHLSNCVLLLAEIGSADYADKAKGLRWFARLLRHAKAVERNLK